MYALLKPTEKKEIDTQQSLGKLFDSKTADNKHLSSTSQNEAQQSLGDFLDRAAADKARFTLTYQNKVFVAVVPIEDEELFEEIEDCIDGANADDALKEGGKPIPWEQIKKELGL